jgi:hypothetical protein
MMMTLNNTKKILNRDTPTKAALPSSKKLTKLAWKQEYSIPPQKPYLKKLSINKKTNLTNKKEKKEKKSTTTTTKTI